MHIWRHLKMLLQAGHAHDLASAAATAEGELIVECPACPHPGHNLPAGWENASLDVETIECPKDVSIGEDAKLEVEHRVNACESEERTSK
jgi:hypothetical protein